MELKQSGQPQLVNKIISAIHNSERRAITFAHFMDMCLYDDACGYYMTDRIKIGKEGDFYTSSSIGTVMGEMLAHYCLPFIEQLFAQGQVIHIVEWGGGQGRLAKHMLDELRLRAPDSYEHLLFTCIEESEFHRKLQQNTLQDHLAKVQWLTSQQWFEQGEHHAIVLSNELLDAFPVHRVQFQHDQWYEIMVTWDDEQQIFTEHIVPLTDERLLQYIMDEHINPHHGQRFEINLAAMQWIERIGHALDDGVLISIDYGAENWELYAPHRMNGTLLCYRRHQAYDDPYRYVGEQDMTAHVNFSACIRAGLQAGFEHWSLSNQKDFLIAAGILNKLKDHTSRDPFHPQMRINRSIRQILLSDQMSELFKVLIQSKRLSIHTKEGPECDA